MASENKPKEKPAPRSSKILSKVPMPVLKDDTGKKTFPNLLDVLSPIYDGGTLVRQAGRMSITPDGSSWRVTIEAPTEGLQTTMLVDSLTTLLSEAEHRLGQAEQQWVMSWKRRTKNLPTIEDLIK